METKKIKNQRLNLISLITGEKKFLVNANFQMRFMFSLILISVFSMSIIYLANDYFFQTYMHKGQVLNLPPDHPFFLMIQEQKSFMTKVYVIVAGSISGIACLWGLFYSHKIAGPLYRLNKYFEDAALSGAPLEKKVYFREDDFFQEVPVSINKYIDGVTGKSQIVEKTKYSA
jgi:hypothetical protein